MKKIIDYKKESDAFPGCFPNQIGFALGGARLNEDIYECMMLIRDSIVHGGVAIDLIRVSLTSLILTLAPFLRRKATMS